VHIPFAALLVRPTGPEKTFLLRLNAAASRTVAAVRLN
jgi:hypothetical protein